MLLTQSGDLYTKFPGKVSICTILPASLVKYFQVHNPNKDLPVGLEEEQDQLIKDVERVNNIRRDYNRENNQVTINTTSRVYKNSLKRYRSKGKKRRVSRFTDKDLPNGVHCTQELKSEIQGIILADILKSGGVY